MPDPDDDLARSLRLLEDPGTARVFGVFDDLSEWVDEVQWTGDPVDPAALREAIGRLRARHLPEDPTG